MKLKVGKYYLTRDGTIIMVTRAIDEASLKYGRSFGKRGWRYYAKIVACHDERRIWANREEFYMTEEGYFYPQFDSLVENTDVMDAVREISRESMSEEEFKRVLCLYDDLSDAIFVIKLGVSLGYIYSP